MGQAEPGWWHAFAIDHGVRSTRTPDKFIRKPQETNIFDLPTGELMKPDRLAELAMSKPEDEIHKRIERLRAAIEAPPVKTFAQKARDVLQPLSTPALGQPKAAYGPRQAEPHLAPEAHDVETPVSETVENVSQPFPETPMTSLLPAVATMFVPSAFQSALYRINMSLKHPLLTLAATATDERQVTETAPAVITEEACGSESLEADVIFIDAYSETEGFDGAAELMELESCDGYTAAPQGLDQALGQIADATNMATRAGSETEPARIKDGILEIVTVGHDANKATETREAFESMPPETAYVPEEAIDLGYVTLYGEETAPIQATLRVEGKVALRSVSDASTFEEATIVEESSFVQEFTLAEDELIPTTKTSGQSLVEEYTELGAAAPVEVTDAADVIVLGEVMLPAQDAEITAPVEAALVEPQVIMLPAPAAVPRSRFAPYELPSMELLAKPPASEGQTLTEDILEERAGRLEKVIRDFGVKGEIIHVHPGPVVTLYELEPAPGVKSSRVIALSEDIARSMSAVSARVAVIPGRNAIGIELPNETRETVYLREMLETADFTASAQKLPICLGKTIGGEPVIADLARMPHLLVAGTTGSGKSVAINTMILSLLYRFTPEQCRLIMVDPKMLELSVYDGIPHLLTPVVTDPKKAIIALRWAVREMEERYKKMARLGVRNIDGFNARVSEARAKGEVITRTVQTGFDKATGELTYTEEVMDLTSLPYIVVIVDEMADLMMVAGKEIEGAIQRLAQMARAAGIHVILATQRPSVDVITGTIKANFPTRISFQVTSKIDSRTILGEMGAEQLLGQGDMLYMAGGGRITRVHGPFCSDGEVEKVVNHLKRQGEPVYLEAVTADDEESEETEVPDLPGEEEDFGLASAGAYEQAVSIVLRHKKASTSYIQRRLQIGYNRAASIMERMEKEGIVGSANHAGKREILRGEFED
jgi:S-DNA-T family DNA segregation ATPase FtsK/SpoIIIE